MNQRLSSTDVRCSVVYNLNEESLLLLRMEAKTDNQRNELYCRILRYSVMVNSSLMITYPLRSQSTDDADWTSELLVFMVVLEMNKLGVQISQEPYLTYSAVGCIFSRLSGLKNTL